MYIQNKYLQVKQEYEIDFAKINIQNTFYVFVTMCYAVAAARRTVGVAHF